MQRPPLWRFATVVTSALVLTASLSAFGICSPHGGQYRPPNRNTPPRPNPHQPPPPPPPTGPLGGSGPVAPPGTGPSGGPTTPGAGPPRGGTPGPATPGPNRGGAGRTGGITLADDATRWSHWWEFNKDRYLVRRASDELGPRTGSDDFYLGAGRRGLARDGLQPTRDDVERRVLPALLAANASTDDRDVVTAAMIAMAKVGASTDESALVDAFAARLARRDQEVRETAALALGLAGLDGDRAIRLLTALVHGTSVASAACGGIPVDDRTRAFAAYALGLAARRSQRLATTYRAVRALRPLVEDRRCNRHVLVGAIFGLGLLPLQAGGASAEPSGGVRTLRASVLATLERCLLDRRGPGQQSLQSHCATAIARLVQPTDDCAARYRALFRRLLQGSIDGRVVGHDQARAAALGLGRLGLPGAAGAAERAVLLDVWRRHRDQQTRYFAVLALGQIGGVENRNALMRELDRGTKALEKPWCALALGLGEHRRLTRSATRRLAVEPDRLVAQALLAEFHRARNRELAGALAVALGLTCCLDAAPALRARLDDSREDDALAGYCCIGLALMRDDRAADKLRGILRTAERRPELMRQCAMALGHLGDRAAARDLHAMLARPGVGVARLAAIAVALGHVGNRRSIGPLVELLADAKRPALTRAFAAAALGGIADPAPVPFGGVVACDINYRAAIESLTGGGTGILDIL